MHYPARMGTAFSCLCLASLLSSYCYETHFSAIEDRDLAQEIKERSLIEKSGSIATLEGLRFLAKQEVMNIIKIGKALGYYEIDASFSIQETPDRRSAKLFIDVSPKEQYHFAPYQIAGDAAKLLDPNALGVVAGKPAIATEILTAEQNALDLLSEIGYPLAYIDRRKIDVDMQKKSVEPAVSIEEGPFARFGPTKIFGLKNVNPRYIERRLAFQEGEMYNALLVAKTEDRLIQSDLFSAVLISHEEGVDPRGLLPMKMVITEAKMRTVSFGVSYATVDGPGGVFNWTNRNLRGMGETLSFRAEGSRIFVGGSLSYKKPDFLGIDQTYTLLGEGTIEKIRAYHAFTYRALNTFEKRLNPHDLFSVGAQFEHITVTKSATNGTYMLLSLPFFFRHDTTDTLLDPTRGLSVVYQGTFFQSVLHQGTQFVKQRLTGCFYFPVYSKITLALRIQAGAIAGAEQERIPLPKLFLGGSEDDLRGYRYKTVSPLNGSDEPLGGRSAIFATFEPRFRLTKQVGFVPFFDIGTVSLKEYPDVTERYFKSVGAGIRYYTYFGPLRADIGFPLDRRSIDPAFRIYASIGQAF